MLASKRTSAYSRRQPSRLSVLLLLGLLSGLAPAVGWSDTQIALAEDASKVHPDVWPKLNSPLPVDDKLEAKIRDLLETMTVEEKVGQIVQGDLGSVTPADLRRYRLGSVLAGGNSDPGGRYNAAPAEWLALADAFYKASMDTSAGGKAIPVLLGIDAVHGHNNAVGATLFPHNIGLGAANDPQLLRKIARATAIELRSTGFEWTFAPTLTVPRDDRWGRTYEGYSENPALVASYAREVVEGLQGVVGSANFLDGQHVAASAKHFIGDGGTDGGRDTGNTLVSEAELRDIHGAGYGPALQAGTQTVMASFSSWNGRKMHGNRELLTDVLKGQMGFDGFVVGDWNAQGKVPGCTNESCPAAVIAGVDMIMAPDSWKGFYTNTVAQVKSGTIPMARLDDAVTRILRVKFRLGLFEAGLPSKRPLGGKFKYLGSAEHRQLARTAVRKSLVLLKNNGQLLPLNPASHVLVAGDGANDMGKQSGGWTLSWQGTGNTRADFPNAQTIWEGIRETTERAGGVAKLSIDGSYEDKPDAAIVVFGEEPYAETPGDIPNLAYKPGKEKDLQLLRRLRAAGIPVVAVFLSGRPMSVNREINASDAFVAAWLPGSEGGGIADVLFAGAHGKPAFDFTGRLSYSWPRRASQSPLNAGQPGYDPQFALGTGLSYGAPYELSALVEDTDAAAFSEPGVYFAKGVYAPGWGLMLAGADNAAQRITSLPASVSGAITVSATDHLAQEDARRLLWSGKAAGRVWLGAEQAVDLTQAGVNMDWLVLTLRIDTPPLAALDLGLACGDTCTARMPIKDALLNLPRAEWTRLGIPRACFAQVGTDLSQVLKLFELRTAGKFEVSISRIAMGSEFDHALDCPKP
jgi:beta-glucosidase